MYQEGKSHTLEKEKKEGTSYGSIGLKRGFERKAVAKEGAKLAMYADEQEEPEGVLASAASRLS